MTGVQTCALPISTPVLTRPMVENIRVACREMGFPRNRCFLQDYEELPAGASARRTVAELQKTLYRIFGRCSQRVLCGQLGFELHPPASSPAPSPSPVHAKHCTGKGKAGGLRPLNTGIYCYYPLLPRCGISPKGKACPRLG